MKKVLVDLDVLDLYFESENNWQNDTRLKSYVEDLLIYSQQPDYEMFFLPDQFNRCKRKSEILLQMGKTGMNPLLTDNEEYERMLHSVFAAVTMHASKLEVVRTPDIQKLGDFPAFRKDRFKSVEWLSAVIVHRIDYLLTVDPYIKLDFLYLLKALEELQKIKNLIIRVHL